MNSKIIKYDDFILMLIREYGENLFFNKDFSDIDFFYKIPKLKDFFNTCNDIYIPNVILLITLGMSWDFR